MFDASDEVYDYIMCTFCPVKLSKPGLSYHAEENSFHERIRDWIVEMPDAGFLFPAFNDRSTDIHNLLYYSKNAENLGNGLTDLLLGCVPPLTAGNQKDTFRTLIEETLGDDCDYDTVKNIHENLNEMIEQNSENPEPLALDKAEVKYLLAKSGVEAQYTPCLQYCKPQKIRDQNSGHHHSGKPGMRRSCRNTYYRWSEMPGHCR